MSVQARLTERVADWRRERSLVEDALRQLRERAGALDRLYGQYTEIIAGAERTLAGLREMATVEELGESWRWVSLALPVHPQVSTLQATMADTADPIPY